MTSLRLLSSQFTFSISCSQTLPLGYAATVGTSAVGAVVAARRRHGRSPLVEKDSWRHGLWPSQRLHCRSGELVVSQAAILGVQIVLRRATVLRDIQWLLYYYCLLFVAFLLFLGFLLLLLWTHYFFFSNI